MRTKYNRRARLWAGGTYYRTIEPGLMGNNISIELVEYGVTDDVNIGNNGEPKHNYDNAEGYVVVTNHNTIDQEILSGPASVIFMEQKLPWNKKIEIYNLASQPRARIISISLQIAAGSPPPPPPVEFGPVDIFGLIHIPPYVSAKLAPRPSEFTSSSVITIKPRTQVYPLVAVSKEETTDGGDSESGNPSTTTNKGWDPADLRAKVTARPDPWIEMLERSGDGEPGSGNTGPTTTSGNNPGDGSTGQDDDKPDVNDEGVDDVFLKAFTDTYMADGDGLPPNPSVERTGPTRSIIHINRGELKNGKMGDLNKVYEWDGSSASSGDWKIY